MTKLEYAALLRAEGFMGVPVPEWLLKRLLKESHGAAGMYGRLDRLAQALPAEDGVVDFSRAPRR
jgi:hypothetical protein